MVVVVKMAIKVVMGAIVACDRGNANWDYGSLCIGRNSYSRKLLHTEMFVLVILFSLLGPGRTYYIPVNSFMLDNLYLSTSSYTNGFLSNNMEVKYNYDQFPIIMSNFAFFPNYREEQPSTYHGDNLAYETGGVAVNWRNGMVLTERLPSNFFYLTEMHYDGCGCYTSSDRWIEANGTAMGLR